MIGNACKLDKHGKVAFPVNCFPFLNVMTFESLERLAAVIQRTSTRKALTRQAFRRRIKTGYYEKFELMRDMTCTFG